jgi:SAM-dependent methyltransferase
MKPKEFYDLLFTSEDYAPYCYAEAAKGDLEKFVQDFSLNELIILDVGCGRGWFKDLVANWIGIDVSFEAGKFNKGKFICSTAEEIPIKNGSVNAIWSITFLEHAENPESVLSEMSRVLVNGGIIYLAPAWRVPPWRPKGYEVKKFSDLLLIEKIVKIFLPLLNLIWMKGFFWIPIRLFREIQVKLGSNKKLNYVSFVPNLNEFILPDSDARNSIDNHEVLLWFLNKGFITPKSTNWINRILMRCGPIIVIKESSSSK